MQSWGLYHTLWRMEHFQQQQAKAAAADAVLLYYIFYNCKTHMHEHSTMISYKLN